MWRVVAVFNLWPGEVQCERKQLIGKNKIGKQGLQYTP